MTGAEGPATTAFTQRQWFIWLAAIVATIVIIGLLGPVLLPFVAGILLAYFLNPVVGGLTRMGLSRHSATLLLLGAAAIAAAALLILVLPIIISQLTNFLGNLPGLLDRLRSFAETMADRLAGMAGPQLKEGLAKAVADASAGLSGSAGAILASAWNGGRAILNVLSLFVVAPVITFFVLHDWDKLVAAIDGWVPRDQVDTVRQLARDIDEVIAGFVRGQGTLCALMGVYYATGFWLAGLDYALLIGFATGLLGFIPFAGALMGGLIALAVAVAQFWPDTWPILVVAGIFAAGQILDGNVLSPNIVGPRVKLHPAWLIFALFAFGYLFGIVGLLVAVPAAAAIGVITRFALGEYLKSGLYRGTTNADATLPDRLP